jgi:MinD-like ATPase involved in chromosome partitioning or flagellar assembly
LILKNRFSFARTVSYDYIFIDSPPNLGLFTLNAMAAAGSLIVPIQAHVYAYKALPQLEATMKLIKKLNPRLHVGGMLITRLLYFGEYQMNYRLAMTGCCLVNKAAKISTACCPRWSCSWA